MKEKNQGLNHESGWASWDVILEKLDQIIELIRTMRKENQLYQKAYEEAKK